MIRPEEVIPLPLVQGYSDGSGPEHIRTTTGPDDYTRSIAVTSWGCGCCRDAAETDGPRAAAVVAMANAYPLALKLAEAAEDVACLASGRVRSCGCLAECVHTYDNLNAALAAFLAHRTDQEGAKS